MNSNIVMPTPNALSKDIDDSMKLLWSNHIDKLLIVVNFEKVSSPECPLSLRVKDSVRELNGKIVSSATDRLDTGLVGDKTTLLNLVRHGYIKILKANLEEHTMNKDDTPLSIDDQIDLIKNDHQAICVCIDSDPMLRPIDGRTILEIVYQTKNTSNSISLFLTDHVELVNRTADLIKLVVSGKVQIKEPAAAGTDEQLKLFFTSTLDHVHYRLTSKFKNIDSLIENSAFWTIGHKNYLKENVEKNVYKLINVNSSSTSFSLGVMFTKAIEAGIITIYRNQGSDDKSNTGFKTQVVNILAEYNCNKSTVFDMSKLDSLVEFVQAKHSRINVDTFLKGLAGMLGYNFIYKNVMYSSDEKIVTNTKD